MKDTCTSCGASPAKTVNGICEWCAAGGWIPKAWIIPAYDLSMRPESEYPDRSILITEQQPKPL